MLRVLERWRGLLRASVICSQVLASNGIAAHLFHVSLFFVITRGAGMQRNVKALPDVLGIVGKGDERPLQQVLVLVEGLGQSVGEIVRHIVAAVNDIAGPAN